MNSEHPQSGAIPPDGAAQEAVTQRDERRHVVVVLAVAVPAGGKLVEVSLVTHSLELGRHLARMARMRPIVLTARRDQDRWIRLARRRHMVSRNAGQELPVLGLVGIAVFIGDRRTYEQLRIAPH